MTDQELLCPKCGEPMEEWMGVGEWICTGCENDTIYDANGKEIGTLE